MSVHPSANLPWRSIRSCLYTFILTFLLQACAAVGVVTSGSETDVDGDADTDADGDSDIEHNGIPCTPENVAEVCDGTWCVDGFCCDDPCEGTCRACNVAGAEGVCMPIPAGQDPINECGDDLPATCGLTGSCDGEGDCQYYGPDTSCDDGQSCTTGDACNGEGSCVGEAPVECQTGPANQCCHASCDESGNCITETGQCEERCSTHQMIVGQECVGCGPARADGICSGGAAHSCNESRHTLCQQLECNGETYYCTNISGTWEWRTSVTCDDSNPCSFGDACSSGECISTAYSCDSDDCTERACDGSGGCFETYNDPGDLCGTETCPADECSGLDWSDYPAECERTCDGSGNCGDCSCDVRETTCGVGSSNDCCEAECTDAGGCTTIPGSCGTEDSCTTYTLDVASVCSGCGPSGANGTCGGGMRLECNATTHSLCQTASCGGNTYYCTNIGGSWQWRRDDARCDDGSLCTYGDTCGGGTCTGTTVTCETTDCMNRSCNGTSECTETPRTGSGCNDGQPCTYGETCSALGECGGGTSISCTSTACVTRACNNTSSCAETILTGTGCDDGNPCTHGDSCNSSGVCATGTPIDCDALDWTCTDYSCNGTSTCTATPINLGAVCDDGDPLTEDDQCQADGSCGGDAGCPPPVEACSNGTQSRGGCSNARVIGRPQAHARFVIDDDTCRASDHFDDSSSCWDANADHTYRLYMLEGETVTIRYETNDPCGSEWSWYGTLKIFENAGCDDTSCTDKVYCDYNETDQTADYTAVRDGWIIIVADGSHASDDEGDYRLTVDLTCSTADCRC